MGGEPNFLDVKIMGREYRVACHIEERPALLAAVELVDSKMREIAQKTKNTIAERVAVMAALNIAHERLSGKESEESATVLASPGLKGRIQDMGARLDTVLVSQQPLDI